MTFRPWVAAACLGLCPLTAVAASGAFLQGTDLDAWSQSLDASDGTLSDAEAEMRFQGASDLFPATGTGSEPQEEFVTVRVDGRDVRFGDVPVRAWFAPYVRTIAELGIISGYRDAAGVPLGAFGPADAVTLEQMTKVLLYASGKDPQSCGGELLNQAVSAWARQFILCAEQAQWSVFSDGSVQAGRGATRAEVAASVLQAFGVQTGNTSGDVFADVGSATLYAAAIERAKSDGIVAGYADADGKPTGFFGPDDPVNRAEFAKMVTIALQVYGKK